MSALHFAVWLAGTSTVVSFVYLILGGPLSVILSELIPDPVGAAFNRLIMSGMFFVSLLGGVGISPRPFSYYNEPDTISYWCYAFYNSLAASGCAVFAYLGVICFACLVLHAGVVRAKIAAGLPATK